MANSFRSLENTIRFGPVREAVHNPKHPKQEKDMSDQVFAGSYRSQHFEVSPDAQRIYSDISKNIDPQSVERAVKQQDQLFGIYKRVLASGYATQQDVDAAERFKKLAQYEVDQYPIKIPHPHIDNIVDMIKQKVKDVPDVVDSITPEQLKKRFDNPPDEYMSSEPMSDKDIDNVKHFHVTRRAAIAKKRYLNTGIDEQQTNKGSQEMSFKQLPPKLVESVKNLLEKHALDADKSGEITQKDVMIRRLESADKQGKLSPKSQELLKKLKGEIKEATGVDPKAIDPHNCATHVYSEQYGNGQCLYSQHDDPDEQGNIKWYDVMFDHGIVRCMTEDLTILVTEMHGHKRKKRMSMKEEKQINHQTEEYSDQLDEAKKIRINPRTGKPFKMRTPEQMARAIKRGKPSGEPETSKPTKSSKPTTAAKPEPAKEEMSDNDKLFAKYPGNKMGSVRVLMGKTRNHARDKASIGHAVRNWLLDPSTTYEHVSNALKNPSAFVKQLERKNN